MVRTGRLFQSPAPAGALRLAGGSSGRAMLCEHVCLSFPAGTLRCLGSGQVEVGNEEEGRRQRKRENDALGILYLFDY